MHQCSDLKTLLNAGKLYNLFMWPEPNIGKLLISRSRNILPAVCRFLYHLQSVNWPTVNGSSIKSNLKLSTFRQITGCRCLNTDSCKIAFVNY
jgi:hypothetical protein